MLAARGHRWVPASVPERRIRRGRRSRSGHACARARWNVLYWAARRLQAVKKLHVVAALETKDPSKVLSLAALYLVGINITFKLTASNGRFSGEAPFCVRTDQLTSFASGLDELPVAPEAARLDDADSDGHIDLWRTDDLGMWA